MTMAVLTTIIIILFISQLITYYCLVMLNGKLSKYKDVEQKQEKIIREMDDAISAYLIEIRDENDRLIKELTETNQSRLSTSFVTEKAAESNEADRKKIDDTVDSVLFDSAINDGKSLKEEALKIVPKSIVNKAYKKQLQLEIDLQPEQTESTQPVVETIEEQIVRDYKAGMTVEEIAKKTQKGKTEIELLIKFHA